MLQIYNLGKPTYNSTASSNTGIKIIANKLHELGLCDEYTSSMLTTSASSSAVGKINITFSDGKSSVLYLALTGSNEKILFVDTEKHFIACMPNLTENLFVSTTVIPGNFFHGLIAEDVFGEIKCARITSLSSGGMLHCYAFFNMPNRYFPSMMSDSFVLTQLAIFNSQTSSQFTEVFYPKNVYFCYDHFYPTGMKLEDNKGIKYVSLTPYILYRY